MGRSSIWMMPLCVLFATAAIAQEAAQRGETVTTRARPDFDPLGVRVGSARLFTTLGLQETYDNNIFAISSAPKGDFITSIDPSMDLRSDWNNHALSFHADSHLARYARYTNENVADVALAANGRLDILRDARILGDAGYRLAHEPRFSPEDVGALRPTEYSDWSGKLTGEKEFSRVSLQLTSAVDRFQYQNGRTAAGAVVNQSLRNRDETQLTLRTGYELAPLRQIYLLTGYNWRDYRSTVDAGGFNRNSTGYTAAVGTRYDVTGILFADLFVGYRHQDYRDIRLAPASGPTGGAKLTWNLSGLTTLTGELSRDVQETSVAAASSYFATRSLIAADHELLRNLLLNANFGYELDSFQGINRADSYYLAGIGAKYLLNRNLSLSGAYGYRSRSSNATGIGFDDHSILLRLTSGL
ncbi:MAG: outer membrane beta-barrel protein [Proteobacteria bacterium]|nr:outer membrane beta-barrel protein [Pseudomonadota bacterium]